MMGLQQVKMQPERLFMRRMSWWHMALKVGGFNIIFAIAYISTAAAPAWFAPAIAAAFEQALPPAIANGLDDALDRVLEKALDRALDRVLDDALDDALDRALAPLKKTTAIVSSFTLSCILFAYSFITVLQYAM
jgi:hypothetical protein